MIYTVVASYREPPSIFCTSVEADEPSQAVEAAWEECAESNWGVDYADLKISRESEWTDTMVIKGEVEVVG